VKSTGICSSGSIHVVSDPRILFGSTSSARHVIAGIAQRVFAAIDFYFRNAHVRFYRRFGLRAAQKRRITEVSAPQKWQF